MKSELGWARCLIEVDVLAQFWVEESFVRDQPACSLSVAVGTAISPFCLPALDHNFHQTAMGFTDSLRTDCKVSANFEHEPVAHQITHCHQNIKTELPFFLF